MKTDRVIDSGPADVPIRVWAVVPCAGTGSRAGGDQPKQYQTVAGQPLVEHTLGVLADVPGIHHIVVVTAPADPVRPGAHLAKVTTVAQGGKSRAETVANGLAALQSLGALPQDWVLVHDAARCLVQTHEVQALLAACWHDEVGGLLAAPVVDTVKQAIEGDAAASAAASGPRVAQTLVREGKWLAQTPQMFRWQLLRQALAFAGAHGVQVTDEASAIEAMGLAPRLVVGSAQNIKVTYPDDFLLAEAIIGFRQKRTQAQGRK